MNRIDNPINAWIATNGFVLRINQDNFKVLVCRILIDPVGVEDTQIGTTSPNTFLGDGFERALEFELIHTLVGRLA